MTTSGFDRRDFLKAGGVMMVTFALDGVGVPRATAQTQPGAGAAAGAAAAAAPKTVALDRVDGFLAIDSTGAVTVYSGKVDLGTGVRTALAQIAAEELCVPLASVTVVQGDTLLTPDQGVTFGSLSIQVGGMQIRQAAATAREALLAQAAARLGADRASLRARDGVVAAAGAAGIGYGELVGDRRLDLAVDPKAPLKPSADYTIVGTSVQRLDIPDKVTGRFTYMQDFRLDGMIHARVVRPPAMKAKLLSFNDWDCREIPGYIGVVRKGDFLAVLSRTEWGAIRAMDAIEARWSDWSGLPEQAKLWEWVRSVKVNKVESFQSVGDPTQAMGADGARTFGASYDFPVQTHGSLGPSCAVAAYEDGKLTCWTASQATHLLRRQLSNMLQMKPDDIRCVYLEGSGCYGRNGHEDAAADAALIAREVGVPVRVQWMREDEHGWDPKGPPTLLDHKAALDASGGITAWQSDVYIPDRPKEIAVTLVAADLAGLPKEEAHPGNIHASLAIPYKVPNIRCSANWLAETPFKPSWIRTPGRMQNTFANESFMDELADAAGVDPMEFRLRYLDDRRGREVLERLAKLADWKPRQGTARDSGPLMRGRGVSYTKYELVRTYVGMVADVEVNRDSGAVKVTRCYVTHDCGQIINPDGLRNQIEGNVVQTVGRTLFEEILFDRSTVTSRDWSTYRTILFPEVPAIDIELINRPEEKPWGAGEPTAAVVPSAIANAVFDASGVRMRSVPFSPAKLLAGLRAI
ncbi:MAG: molybdopterin-dependent oxidoreductase [Burkholderiaceae bacterium]|nr:molybdopterin-dependent oxidoreductase [Burkholderiaceae bacterium]